MAAAAHAVIDDQPDDDAAGVVLSVIDVFPGAADPFAEARHAIPRLAAAAAFVAASAGRTHFEHVGECAVADALRDGEGRKRALLFEKTDRLADDAFAFDCRDNRVRLATIWAYCWGAVRARFISAIDLIGEIIGESERREKCAITSEK